MTDQHPSMWRPVRPSRAHSGPQSAERGDGGGFSARTSERRSGGRTAIRTANGDT
jgi:hypothetical protein